MLVYKVESNKTRETQVLSRPAICWIHYVQIALIISKHLSQAYQPSTSEMLKNAHQCTTIFKNTQKCSKILHLAF